MPFVFACSKCKLGRSTDCPLVELLEKNHEETEGGLYIGSNQQSRTPNEGIVDDAPNADIGQPSQEARKENTCERCNQERCQTCTNGHMKFVLDLKDHSKTFADEILLCAMCEHRLCSGSHLVVVLRCWDCGHEGCEDCGSRFDELDEERYLCCQCSKGSDVVTGAEKTGEGN